MTKHTKYFPTLYGMSSKGTIKVWTIHVEQNGTHSTIIVEHGQLGGKIQVSPETIREGKNLGRSNETTHYDQACLEAESKWKKKHDSNYTEQRPTIDRGMGKITPKLLPMLAQKYHERKQHLQWPAYIQPKLNGVRCLVQRKGDRILFWSRKAKLYKNFNLYMEDEFLSFMKDEEILDGEMYNHGKITFQQLISLIKDEKEPDIEGLKKYVKFHCYDRPNTTLGFADRYIKTIYDLPLGLKYMRLVATFPIKREKDIEMRHGQFLEEGYEGSIIRTGANDPYRFQYRDNQLLKKKDFVDDEFTIIGCKEGTGKDEGKAIFHCATKHKTGGRYGDGTFDVRCKGTDDVREEQWNNRKKYIGGKLTVRYQSLSDDGMPIFPVGITVRDYE